MPTGHRLAGDDEGFPTTRKMEFPKYDDIGDSLLWLNRYERYFRFRRTPDNRRVAYVSFYLTDDAQLWYHKLELNSDQPPWSCFVQLVNKRFGVPLTDNLISELALLWCDGSVDDFTKRFMALLPRHCHHRVASGPTLHRRTGQAPVNGCRSATAHDAR
jgi:hypothetical protein